ILNFKAGDTVRLRIINASASTYFWLKYSGSKMSGVVNDDMEVSQGAGVDYSQSHSITSFELRQFVLVLSVGEKAIIIHIAHIHGHHSFTFIFKLSTEVTLKKGLT